MTSIHRCNFLLLAMIFSLPYINLSVLSGSKLNLSYLVTLASIPFVLDLIKKSRISSVDIAFSAFIVTCCATAVVNHGLYAEVKSLTQIVNFIFCYLLYFITKTLLTFSDKPVGYWLSAFYKYNNVIIILGLGIYILGLAKPDLAYRIAIAFNNSGNYTFGGMSGTFSELGPARSMGFSPEASFWGIYAAANFCVGALHFRKHWIPLIINFVAVVATVSRTGYLLIGIFLALILVWKLRVYLPVMLLALAIVALGIDWESLFLLDDASSVQRFDSVFFSAALSLERPLAGYGLGSFTNMALSNQKDYLDIFSLYFYLLYSTGVIGLAFFISMLLLMLQDLQIREKINLVILFLAWLTASAVNLPYIWFLAALFAVGSRGTKPVPSHGQSKTNARNSLNFGET